MSSRPTPHGRTVRRWRVSIEDAKERLRQVVNRSRQALVVPAAAVERRQGDTHVRLSFDVVGDDTSFMLQVTLPSGTRALAALRVEGDGLLVSGSTAVVLEGNTFPRRPSPDRRGSGRDGQLRRSRLGQAGDDPGARSAKAARRVGLLLRGHRDDRCHNQASHGRWLRHPLERAGPLQSTGAAGLVGDGARTVERHGGRRDGRRRVDPDAGRRTGGSVPDAGGLPGTGGRVQTGRLARDQHARSDRALGAALPATERRATPGAAGCEVACDAMAVRDAGRGPPGDVFG